MKTKEKLITIAAALVLLLLLAGVQAFKGAPKTVTEASQLKGKTLGGVETRMPAGSALIFFDSLMGVKLGGYNGYGTLEEAVCALKTGKVSALWVCDCTADYLCEGDPSLQKLDTKGMSALENSTDPRFSFGLALRNDEEGNQLKDELNSALKGLEAAGYLDELEEKYIVGAREAEPFTLDDAISAKDVYREIVEDAKPLRIGYTGAVAPIELVDASGEPYGYCVALCDDLAIILERRLEMVKLDNETALTSLMGGAVDAVFCYGFSPITTEGTKDWVMTDGYYPMNSYEFITVKGEE